MAHCQALDTPSAPHFGPIPSETNTSYPQEWWEGARSGKYSTIPSYVDWCLGVLPEPTRLFDSEAENSRAVARRQALESPLAPQTLAIPQSKITSYPGEWRDGARSSKYTVAISLFIRDGVGANNQNLLNQSLWVHLYRLSGHSVWSLDLVLKLNLLKNLSLRYHDGQAGFGSRGSGQIISMVMILLLIV